MKLLNVQNFVILLEEKLKTENANAKQISLGKHAQRHVFGKMPKGVRVLLMKQRLKLYHLVSVNPISMEMIVLSNVRPQMKKNSKTVNVDARLISGVLMVTNAQKIAL